MTVVVRDVETEKILVYGKGADEVMFKSVSPDEYENLSKSKEMIKKFASEGLRTLSMGYKEITQKDYDSWLETFQKANQEIHERDVCCFKF